MSCQLCVHPWYHCGIAAVWRGWDPGVNRCALIGLWHSSTSQWILLYSFCRLCAVCVVFQLVLFVTESSWAVGRTEIIVEGNIWLKKQLIRCRIHSIVTQLLQQFTVCVVQRHTLMTACWNRPIFFADLLWIFLDLAFADIRLRDRHLLRNLQRKYWMRQVLSGRLLWTPYKWNIWWAHPVAFLAVTLSNSLAIRDAFIDGTVCIFVSWVECFNVKDC